MRAICAGKESALQIGYINQFMMAEKEHIYKKTICVHYNYGEGK